MADPLQPDPLSEISREEILKQIFGDIGEIIDGEFVPMTFCVSVHPN